MDPSLSISNDPHHPPQFTPFPPFSTANPFVSGAVSAPNHPLFGGPGNPSPYNNHVFQPQLSPQTQTPPPPQASPVPQPPSYNHPPYSEMICAAIAALNEPDGSSKMAISRYIERLYTGLPPAHGALLTHHLKTLKSSGVLAMVKKSYKFAASLPPESVAVAAAATAAGLEAPRSETVPINTVNDQRLLDPVSASGSVSGSASQPQKRGRGRPPKPKPEAQPQQQQQPPSDVQPVVQSNGQQNWEHHQLALVTKPTEELQESAKRRPGRPRKDGSSPIVQAPVMAGGIMKRRGRPPGRRAAGRQRKPQSVSSTASVYPYVANGARRRGRPKRIDTSGTVASEGGELVPVAAPGMKRGRGRPPKIGGVISMLMKPKRGRGRPAGRPRKYAITPQDSGYGELKKKFDLFVEKAKTVLNVLKTEVTSDNPAVVQAIQDLEGLTAVETVEPQAMEEVQPEEGAGAANTEAETHGEEQGQKKAGGEEAQAQTQTEAEAMQEALF